MAATLKALILDAVELDADPGAVIGRVNARFATVAPADCFASLLVARWEPVTRSLRFASAGHEPALLLTGADGQHGLDATGTLLGVLPDGVWDTATLEAPTGAVLVCLTDGVTEAMDAGGNQFGRDRLSRAVGRVGADTPERIVAAVDEAVRCHLGGCVPADDYTLAAVRFG